MAIDGGELPCYGHASYCPFMAIDGASCQPYKLLPCYGHCRQQSLTNGIVPIAVSL